MLPVWDKQHFLLLLKSKDAENKSYAPLRGKKEGSLCLLKGGIGFTVTACRVKGDCILPWLTLSCFFFCTNPTTNFRWTFTQAMMTPRAQHIKGKFVTAWRECS